jgi:signal transduction histidine kinase/ActR/RegA family two-component response regulator
MTEPGSSDMPPRFRGPASARPAILRGRGERSIVLGAAAVTAAFSVAALMAGPWAILFDDIQELVASGGGAFALALAWRRTECPSRRLDLAMAAALGSAFLGMVMWDLSHTVGTDLTMAGDSVFVVGACVGAAAVVRAIFAPVQRDRLLGVAIDTVIVFLAGIAVVAALWRSSILTPGDRTASVGAVLLIAATAGCAFTLFARRVGWATPGPWALLAGTAVLAVSWLMWIANPSTPSAVDLPDFMFSAGLLIMAYGTLGWDTTPSDSPAFDRIATVFNSILPVAAIVGSLALLALTRETDFADLLGIATAAVIVTSAARQLHLYARVARARAALGVRTAEVQAAVAALEREAAQRQRLEAEREAMQERMVESQRLESIGRLAGGVAHDFNNLLTAIRGYADLAGLRLPADDEGQADLAAIRHAADQASSLTRQLLAFSRNQQLRPSVVDLGDVVLGAEPLLRRLLGERIELVVRPAPDLWAVLVDPSQLESIIVNLAVNARDAMESGGQLTIETANAELDQDYARTHSDVAAGAYAMLSVADTGTGMDDATLAHMFEPFFTTKGPGRGTGLGLSTVYGTVRQSGGHIAVSSEVGRGTTFRVYLPRTEAARAVGGAAAAASSSGAAHEVILVAEDEGVVRDMVVAALKRRGYTVLAVPSGEEALDVLGRDQPEVGILLTDVVMSGMDGLELIDRARRMHPGLHAICMSGYTPLALSSGPGPKGVEFLGKPFTLEALEQAIRKILGESHSKSDKPARTDRQP